MGFNSGFKGLKHAIITQNIHHHENLKSHKRIFDQFLFNSIIITILPNIYQKSFLHLHGTYLEGLRGKVVNNVNIRCRSMVSFMIATERELLVPTGQADEWIAESFLTQW